MAERISYHLIAVVVVAMLSCEFWIDDWSGAAQKSRRRYLFHSLSHAPPYVSYSIGGEARKEMEDDGEDFG